MELVQGRFHVNRHIRASCAEIGKHILRYAGFTIKIAKDPNRNILGHTLQQVQRLDIDIVIDN